LRGREKRSIGIERHSRIRSTSVSVISSFVRRKIWSFAEIHVQPSAGRAQAVRSSQVNCDPGGRLGMTSNRGEKTPEANFADRFGVSRSTLYRNTAGLESPKMLMMYAQSELIISYK
jgi:hypothetical protein